MVLSSDNFISSSSSSEEAPYLRCDIMTLIVKREIIPSFS